MPRGCTSTCQLSPARRTREQRSSTKPRAMSSSQGLLYVETRGLGPKTIQPARAFDLLQFVARRQRNYGSAAWTKSLVLPAPALPGGCVRGNRGKAARHHLETLVELVVCDHERRQEADDVAERARGNEEHSALAREPHDVVGLV